jgi:glycine amidinotransferase
VRDLFEKIAVETEEDYQAIVKKLQEFGVEVHRPNLPKHAQLPNGRFLPPPMTPRDYTVMIGDQFYESYQSNHFKTCYNNIKDSSWPDCNTTEDFYKLPKFIQDECVNIHHLIPEDRSCYNDIYDVIKNKGNIIINSFQPSVNGAMVSRIGRDLYFGTQPHDQDQIAFKQCLDKQFTQTRNHIVDTRGHSDATYCPVCPGLIVSLRDVPTYADTFPDWEVVYLPNQSWAKVKPFLDLKQKNKGKWWIPGFENDQAVVDVVETWLGHWTGYVEETVFDVNMLIIDPKNVMVFNYNKQVFDALDRYGITAHVVPFRHRYFWDGGIHCVTSDLHREGVMQDYFPSRL